SLGDRSWNRNVSAWPSCGCENLIALAAGSIVEVLPRSCSTSSAVIRSTGGSRTGSLPYFSSRPSSDAVAISESMRPGAWAAGARIAVGGGGGHGLEHALVGDARERAHRLQPHRRAVVVHGRVGERLGGLPDLPFAEQPRGAGGDLRVGVFEQVLDDRHAVRRRARLLRVLQLAHGLGVGGAAGGTRRARGGGRARPPRPRDPRPGAHPVHGDPRGR